MADDGKKLITHWAVLMCPHGGAINMVVHYKDKKAFVNNAHAITEAELLHGRIVGCTNKPPCLKVASVPPDGLARQVLVEKSYPVLETVKALSNTSFPVVLTHDIHAMLIADEGMDLTIAPDHKGLPTLGVGHLSNQNKDEIKATLKDADIDYDKLLKDKSITVEQARKLLDNDVANNQRLMQAKIRTTLKAIKGNTRTSDGVLGGLTEAQRAVLTSLTFQKGHLPQDVANAVVKQPMDPEEVAKAIDNVDVTEPDGLNADGTKKYKHMRYADRYTDRAGRWHAWFTGGDTIPVLGVGKH